jgi:plastocyanin
MRRLAPLVAVCMLAAAFAAPAAAAASPAVTIRDFSFAPATVNVKAGDTVTWKNDGKADHTATGKGFDTGVLSPGASGSFTFKDAGTFAYVCTIHPNMKGTVKVAAAKTRERGRSSGSKRSKPSASRGTRLPKTGGEELRLAGFGALLLALGAAARLGLARRRDAR